jgi:glycerol-3-phosphate dehydrogenase
MSGTSSPKNALPMNRDAMLAAVRSGGAPWDLVIIGGGATGLGSAVDAASRGYRTLLLERSDFAQGTSSRSTKLVHGGVRYLRQGNVSLVTEALLERGRLLANAPHLVRDTPFVIPSYRWTDRPFYGIGLKLYDLLAGRSGFGRSRFLSKEQALELAPTLNPQGLDGGVVYHDGQFDDTRLAINLAQTAVEQGAALLNYARVVDLIKTDGKVRDLRAVDDERGETFEVGARAVVNATGVFTDAVRRMDEPDARTMVSPSQGVHIVLDRSFLPGQAAIMVPKTDDGRVLFAVPWHSVVLVGTTDTPVKEISPEPRALKEELRFLIDHAGRYLSKRPFPSDVLSVFVGLRPLVSSAAAHGNTAKLARDHTLAVSDAGLVTITGGKWTTYRRMAEDTVDRAAAVAGLPIRPCITQNLRLHGGLPGGATKGELSFYGSDAAAIEALMRERPEYAERLHERLPVTVAQVVWAVRHEMARTVEDVLSRRTRCLIFDAAASIEAAPRVADVMAAELGRDDVWKRTQIERYAALARGYLMPTLDDDDAGVG